MFTQCIVLTVIVVMSLSLNDNDMSKLDDIICRGRLVQKGTILFQQGEVFKSVHAV
jgi:CRP/FNR family transcriptional regulator